MFFTFVAIFLFYRFIFQSLIQGSVARIDLPAFRYTPRMAPNWQGQNRILTMSGEALRNAANTVPILTATVISAATVTA